jgi:hypothetical protein
MIHRLLPASEIKNRAPGPTSYQANDVLALIPFRRIGWSQKR